MRNLKRIVIPKDYKYSLGIDVSEKMNAQDLRNLSEAYTQLSAKKDDSYLETDVKKRQKNNEKARKDMEKMGTSMKNPHFEEVRGQDTEMRKAASADRKAGDKKLPPSEGKANADKMQRSIKFYDKLTKKEELELDENRRAARAAGGYKDDSKKQSDPSKAGFTGVGNMSIDQIRKMSARMDKEKTQKEGVIPEAKYEAGASTYGKMSIRNKRAVGYGGNAAPPEERTKAHDERMKKHKAMKEEVKIDESHKNPESVKGIAKELDKAVEMHKSQAKRLRKSGVSEEKEESKVGGGNLKKLTAKAVKRIDADVDGDVDGKDSNKAGFGEFVPSADGKKKIKTKIQKEDYISNWREEIIEGKDKDDTDKDIDVMKGKNKIKVMPELGEECEKCGGDHDTKDHKKEEEDPRGMNTKVNLMRNKLRAMGLKMSHQPEGEMVEQVKTEKKEDEKKSEPSASGPTADEKQMIAKKRQMMLKTQMIQKQKLNLQKQGKLPITSEATEDSLRDRRMERGGVDGNNRYNKPVSNTPNTFGKKKPKYDGMSALEKVKASIRAKHGQGAIMDTKKK